MNTKTLISASILAVLISFPPFSSAQTFAPGQFQIGGIPVSCGPAITVLRGGIGDSARAVPGNPPAIILDPSLFGSFPVPVQFFVYAHECGHHVVGSNENAADCWAAKLGRDQGWFTNVTMNFLTQVFQWNPGDWTHAPGPIRLQNIANCYSNPP
jgi:hypothetical protein